MIFKRFNQKLMSLIRNMRGKMFSKYIFENSLFTRAYLQYIYFSEKKHQATTMAARSFAGREENWRKIWKSGEAICDKWFPNGPGLASNLAKILGGWQMPLVPLVPSALKRKTGPQHHVFFWKEHKTGKSMKTHGLSFLLLDPN